MDPQVNSLTLLTESGATLAAMLSRTDAGRAFRRWVVDELIPSWRRMKAGRSEAEPADPFSRSTALRDIADRLAQLGEAGHATAVLLRAAQELGVDPEPPTPTPQRVVPVPGMPRTDHLVAFLNSAYVERVGERSDMTSVIDVYRAYLAWCRENYAPGRFKSMPWVTKYMGNLGIPSSGGYFYGLLLKKE